MNFMIQIIHTIIYIAKALIIKDGGFVVSFANILEAITQGETKEDALATAKDALESALDFYFELLISGRINR